MIEVKGMLTTHLGATTDDIQWMPPGRHNLQATSREGKPVEFVLLVDASTAEVVEASRKSYAAEALAGTGDTPYLDFNHEDREASAWVKEFYWAGEDPKKGGVRVKIEWTAAGKAAVEGKTFRRFSPEFRIGIEPESDGMHRVIGAPCLMGGLVNRAAFRSIQDIFARFTGDLGLIKPKSNNMDDEIKALKAQIDTLTKRNSELEVLVADMQAKQAEEIVCKAIQEGRIPSDPHVKAKWLDSAKKDPSSLELLASLPKAAVLETVYTKQDTNKPAGSVSGSEQIMAKYASIQDANERLDYFRTHKQIILNSI